MKNTIKLATLNEKRVISTLLQAYLEELSHYPGEVIEYKDESGTYNYPFFDTYWRENQRYPYLLFEENRTAGFALVRRKKEHWEMAEFYVLPEFRRRGLGMSCALDIFKNHLGKWEIHFNKYNLASRSLWHKSAISLSKDISTGELNSSHEYIRFLANLK